MKSENLNLTLDSIIFKYSKNSNNHLKAQQFKIPKSLTFSFLVQVLEFYKLNRIIVI